MSRVLRAALALAVLVGSGTARAQTAPTTQATCSGLLQGDPIGLAFPDGTGALQSVAATWTGFVFNKAECDCATTDLALQLQLIPMALPLGTVANNQVWVGNGCDSYAARVLPNSTQCEQIMTAEINQTSFNTGAPALNGFVDIHIPSRSLVSPNTHVCTAMSATNDIYVFSITNDPMNPAATCHLQLQEQLLGPGAPTGVAAGSGDSAVTLSWTSPSSTQVQPYQFQVLCSDACGNPVPGQGTETLGYSTCTNGVIHRRPLPTASSIGTVPTADGGTTVVDLGGTSVPIGAGLGTEAAPLDGGVSDGGVCTLPDGGLAALDGGVTDAGVSTGFTPFAALDPKYLCSGPILVAGTGSYSSRIGGLVNGQTYLFTVVAIDQFGNPTAGGVVSGLPAQTEDLYRRLYAGGNHAHGFCFIATAAFGSYESRYVKVLREFRDQVLMPSESGRAFVDWYYAHSPPAAEYIAEHRGARVGTQLVLWPVIGVAALWLYLAAWEKALLATLLFAWFYRRRIARLVRTARPTA